MIEFGEQLRMAREAKGLTQKALGDKLYVSRQSISHWECGDRYPDLVTLKKISQILEVSLDNLLSGKEMVKVVEKKPVIENKIINSMIAALYAFIVLMLFLKVTEDLAMHYVHAYARFVTQETSGVYYTDTNMAVEQIVLMFVFVYGLINTIRDTLTPKKIGVVLIVFFMTNLIFHVIALAVLNHGYSDYYQSFVAEGNDVAYYIRIILEDLILPAVLGIAGIVSSYFYFVRDGKQKIWRNVVVLVSVLGILNKAFLIASKMKMLKFYTMNSSTATIADAKLLVGKNMEELVLAVAVYALVIYQVCVLWRKRKLAKELSTEQTQNATAG